MFNESVSMTLASVHKSRLFLFCISVHRPLCDHSIVTNAIRVRSSHADSYSRLECTAPTQNLFLLIYPTIPCDFCSNTFLPRPLLLSFEEMRMRYERRDPRQEDLQQIEELKSVIESQDRDLRLLTEQFREMQLHERELQQRLYQQQQLQQQQPPQPPRRAKNRGKQQQSQQNDHIVIEEDEQQQEQQQQHQPQIQIQPMTASVPIVCDVIYEENEADLIQEEQDQTATPPDTVQEDQQTEQPEQIVEQHHDQQIQTEVIVDVPESSIETLIDVVQSTEPVFIDSIPSASSNSNAIAEETSSSVQEPEVSVIEINCLPESKSVDSEVSPPIPTPSIVITTENEESIEPEQVEVCISTVVELPAPHSFIKIVEDPFPAAEAQTEVQQKVQNMPEMIVIREPDVIAEAKAAVAATAEVSTAVDVVVCVPGTRSSST